MKKFHSLIVLKYDQNQSLDSSQWGVVHCRYPSPFAIEFGYTSYVIGSDVQLETGITSCMKSNSPHPPVSIHGCDMINLTFKNKSSVA